jgi:hypothetical protein
MSRNLEALTSWNPVGLFRPVMGQLYLYVLPETWRSITINVDFHDYSKFLQGNSQIVS